MSKSRAILPILLLAIVTTQVITTVPANAQAVRQQNPTLELPRVSPAAEESKAGVYCASSRYPAGSRGMSSLFPV